MEVLSTVRRVVITAKNQWHNQKMLCRCLQELDKTADKIRAQYTRTKFLAVEMDLVQENIANLFSTTVSTASRSPDVGLASAGIGGPWNDCSTSGFVDE